MKHLFTLAGLLLSFGSFAQIPSGTHLFSGNVALNVQKDVYPLQDENRYTSFGLTLGYGKAVKDNVVSGARLSFNLLQNNYGQSTSSSHGVGAQYFRQRYLPLVHSFMAFGEGTAGASYGWGNEGNYNSYGASAGLGAGLAYRAGKCLMFTLGFPNALGVGVTYAETKQPTGTNMEKRTSFNASISSGVQLSNLQFGVVLMK